jgi:predicted permease
MLGGLTIGLICVTVFDLHGLVRTMVILLSSAPSGILTLTYAAMEDLDGDLAAGIVSYSTMIGLLLIPLLMTFLPAF